MLELFWSKLHKFGDDLFPHLVNRPGAVGQTPANACSVSGATRASPLVGRSLVSTRQRCIGSSYDWVIRTGRVVTAVTNPAASSNGGVDSLL